MTTASALLSATPAAESPSTQALQDVLYDTLAVGVDSDASATTASAIETFLHEHARSPKPREAFLAFFREQGLSLGQARALGAAPQALPPLKLVAPAPRALDASQLQAAESLELAEPVATRSSRAVASMHAALAAPGGQRSMLTVWSALALVAVVLGMALGIGQRQLEALSAQLETAQEQSRSQAEALAALQQRLAQVQAGVAQSGQRMERVEKQNALLLEWLPPTTPAQ